MGKLFKTTIKEWNDRDPFRQSAVIAYYAIFSIPGLLVLIVRTAGYLFGKDIVNQNLTTEISKTMGADTATQVREMLINASQAQSTIWGSMLAAFILLLGATGVFVELQKTLNEIWQVKAVPQNGILAFLKARLFSFGLILAIAFLLLISLVISTALAAMSKMVRIEASESIFFLIKTIHFIFSLIVISILFALMFKILPDAKIKWRHVWLGSLLTGLLFTLGKTALAFYFSKAEPASVYGAAGSVILILLWVSYSSLIVFFGATLTATFARMYSRNIPPTEIAVKEVKTN